VTIVNTHPTQPVELDMEVFASKLNEAEVVALAADDMHAHNTFDQPERVHLFPAYTLVSRGQNLRVTLPAGSVTRITGKPG
jgi:alpha-N-arabinofuranosidase